MQTDRLDCEKVESQTAFAPPTQSLVKSSWESRDQPTIIPQGVPYMVKLLRYYVSEDAVYLHLEHLQGETLHCHCSITWVVFWLHFNDFRCLVFNQKPNPP